MKLAGALLPLLPDATGVIALVGGGGKTSALFRLAAELAGQGRRVLVTATTHLWDPRLEARPPLELILRPDLEAASAAPGAPLPVPGRPGLTVLLARAAEPPGKLKGLHPAWIPALAAAWDVVLVEADGSRGLPVKAPAPHEPVLPHGPHLVLGVVGLDCLGRPLDARIAHRPERFAAVTGCEPGEPIGWPHLEALARHPEGLFKGAAGPRALLFNKADQAPEALAGLRPEAFDAGRVLAGTLEPVEAVIVLDQGKRP